MNTLSVSFRYIFLIFSEYLHRYPCNLFLQNLGRREEAELRGEGEAAAKLKMI